VKREKDVKKKTTAQSTGGKNDNFGSRGSHPETSDQEGQMRDQTGFTGLGKRKRDGERLRGEKGCAQSSKKAGSPANTRKKKGVKRDDRRPKG